MLKQLWPFLWSKDLSQLRIRFFFSFVCLILSKIALIMVPFLFKAIVDTLVDQQYKSVFVVPISLIIIYALARLLNSLFSELKDALFVRITQRSMREAGLKVFKHLHQLDLAFHLERQTGGLNRVIERGIKGIEKILTFLSFNIMPTLFEIMIVTLLLWLHYDYRFAWITLIAIASYIFFTIKMTQWRIQFVRAMNQRENEAQTKAIDSLLNFETVKYFNNEDHEAHRFDDSLKEYEKAAVQHKLSLAYLNIGQATIITTTLGGIMLLASYGIQEGSKTIGDLVAVNAFLIQLYVPLFNLGFSYREIKLSLVNMESMFELLSHTSRTPDKEKAKEFVFKEGRVVFEHVSFSYQIERSILQDISFTIEPGKTLAIVGASGSGKTTIGRLLFRFFDVKEGKIIIDGQDIRDITQSSLRRVIGVVPQDTVLFNESILYNIAYGNPSSSFDDIVEASKLAHIYDFIVKLPRGYETVVGERGLKLSGGEKQRVSIARALLKKPKIFLFDEATSSLDTHTEKIIQENLKTLSQNHTTLIIAHRLSTITHADEIIVLDHGQILEKGRHQELLEKKGYYATLWKKQLHKRTSSKVLL
ncbi:MAG: ABC transporter ATP-binding protein/permease [Proteobacteria bacterium]|nr:ABC transporter ATP-binding protein/permease [Pseudomonadota bacterium]